MSEVENALVKRGLWTNWDQGPVMGRTITTDAATGNVIIALLTVLITIATAQLWNLLTFAYHQIRATGIPSDGLFWQQQALLRTLPTPTGLIADSFKMWWTWRHKSERPFLRSMLPVLFASLFALGAVSSGIFSSYAVDTSNIEVLVNSPYCGKVNLSRTFEPQTGASTHFANLWPVMKSYARDCYKDGSQFLPSHCHNTFVQPNISMTRDPTQCPWDSSMCLTSDNPAISMDSGLIDASDFGFNVQPQHGVKYRKKTVCNVLPLDNYISVHNATGEIAETLGRDPLPDEKVIALSYLYNKGNASLDDSGVTFKISMLQVNISESYMTNSRIVYSESRDPTLPDVFPPLATMNRSDADVGMNVVWLNKIQYNEPSDDPLFSAHVHRNFTSEGINFPVYASDKAGGVMGCAIQYQFCIARKRKEDNCTSLIGLPSIVDNTTWPEATDTQLLILQLLRDASLEMDVTTAPLYGYTEAGELLYKGQLPSVPNDQWKTEAIGWESLAWTGIQIRMTDYAVGPKVRDPNADQYMEPITTDVERQLCGSMKMRKSGGFANVNVFGLAFIIAFSALVLILNTFILRFCIFMSRFRRALAPRLDRWVQDGVLQLQRRAFDAQGQGTWFGTDKEVPSTLKGQELKELPEESVSIRMRKTGTGFGGLTFRSTTGTTVASQSTFGKKEKVEEREVSEK